MADTTILLMTAARPYAELGDDERMLIGGMQDRGFQVERLETRRLNVLSTVVLAENDRDELLIVRGELRTAAFRLNWMSAVALLSTGLVLFGDLRDSYKPGVWGALGALIAIVLLRFVCKPKPEVR